MNINVASGKARTVHKQIIPSAAEWEEQGS